MDRKLPFIWKNPGIHRDPRGIQEAEDLKKKFMLFDECEEFQRWVRYGGGAFDSTFIWMPAAAFYKNKQTYRSDIIWMWKLLAGHEGRVELGGGVITLLHTQEPQLYKPGSKVETGSWAEPDLLWKWILFVTEESWFKQKRGTLRKFFKEDADVGQMLHALSEEMIMRGE